MKHAYLIIAHNEFDLLEKQLRLLDDPRNDFYIHIDKKVTDFPFDSFHRFLKHSGVHYVDRLDVRWGDFSQIQSELILLEAAVKGNYRYYHLLSGVDLPLKSNDEIHDFFRENDGKQMVSSVTGPEAEQYRDRINRYHCMRLRYSKKPVERLVGNGIFVPLWLMAKAGLHRAWDAQKVLAYGPNWFSITHDFARYVLEQKSWIHQYFHYSCCADELFLQTILENSPFAREKYQPEKGVSANMRLVDWSRSNGKNPWIYRMEDYEQLIQSPCLFARKFSQTLDAEVVEAIFRHVQAQNKG